MSRLDDIRLRIEVQREVLKRAQDKDAEFLSKESILTEQLGKETFRCMEHELHMAIFDEKAKLLELEKEERDILYHSK